MDFKNFVKLDAISKYMECRIQEEGFDVTYEVENVYTDYGRGISQLTIICQDEKADRHFQIFCPRELNAIQYGTFDSTDVDEVIEKHVAFFNKWGTTVFQ